tara:strand:- start:86 stop:718 length:633 start_codon:yes stop_codon:yes gene_type:complete
MKPEVKVLKPFGPSIAKVKIPEETVNALNKYVDETVKDQKKMEELNHGKNLAGNVKQEFKLTPKTMEELKWGSFLMESAAQWIGFSTGKKISKFEIISSWIVRQFEHEYNPIHYHGGHISGVGYLKVPKNLGEYYQEGKRMNVNGQIELIHGSAAFLSESTYKIKPEVGDFYFFPHHLMHTVYPFKGTNEERRSISFNAKVDDRIFDIFT